MKKIKDIFKLLVISWGILLGLNTLATPISSLGARASCPLDEILSQEIKLKSSQEKPHFQEIYHYDADKMSALPADSPALKLENHQLTWQTRALPHLYDDTATFAFAQKFHAPKSNKTWPKASSEHIKKTRYEFEKKGGVRENYWKNEYANNKGTYSPQNQALIKQGKTPFGTDGKRMVLHHKIPIEYGGTNDLSNLQPMRYSDHSLKPNFGPLHTPPFDN